MNVKGKVLKILEENRGQRISGATVADTLGVSRGAVWKAIESLRKEGYQIVGVTNKGYYLSEKTDLISAESVRLNLKETYQDIEIKVLKSVGSTNDYGKSLGSEGDKNTTLIVAEEQLAGKGRMGRLFYSPSKKGIYLSLLLKPDKPLHIQQGMLVTTAASVAAAEAISEVCGKEVSIKWVNDLYYDNQKVAGILTEAVTDFESGYIQWLIIGIGINYYLGDEGFPDDLEPIATALYKKEEEAPLRSVLIGSFVNRMLDYFKELKAEDFLEEYKKRSFVLGKEIRVVEGKASYIAKAITIDEQGGLVIETEGGNRSILSSGEISIRKVK